jgi:hypothetical protein
VAQSNSISLPTFSFAIPLAREISDRVHPPCLKLPQADSRPSTIDGEVKFNFYSQDFPVMSRDVLFEVENFLVGENSEMEIDYNGGGGGGGGGGRGGRGDIIRKRL